MLLLNKTLARIEGGNRIIRHLESISERCESIESTTKKGFLSTASKGSKPLESVVRQQRDLRRIPNNENLYFMFHSSCIPYFVASCCSHTVSSIVNILPYSSHVRFEIYSRFIRDGCCLDDDIFPFSG